MEHGASLLTYLFLALGLFPIVGGIGWGLWETFIGPRLIASEEVTRLADELVAAYPDDPERAALINEDRAWRRCEGVEQGKWKRVRQEIRRRQGRSTKNA